MSFNKTLTTENEWNNLGTGQPVQVLQCKKGEQQQSVQEQSLSVHASSCASFILWNKHSSFKKQGTVDSSSTHKANM